MIDIREKVGKSIENKSIENYYKTGSESSVKVITGAAKKESYVKNKDSVNVDMPDSVYTRPDGINNGETAADQMVQGNGLDAKTRQNQMIVLSNTTSAEDYKKMQEDGFSLTDTDSQTIITETDKIKAVLAKAGVDISVYGDDLDEESLKEITGSEALASMIMQTLQQNDIPLTEENVSQTETAYNQAVNMGSISEYAAAYVLKNGEEPTIDNLYKANYSGAGEASQLSETEFDQLKKQLSDIIADAGLEADDQTYDNCKWLIENNIAVTGDNLRYLEQLQVLINGGLPDDEAVLGAIADAISEGKRPGDAMLIEGYSMTDKAENAKAVIDGASSENIAYLVENNQEITIENLEQAERNNFTAAVDDQNQAQIKARRQLEETRLAMTTEANLALLKKGISIDTKPLEELVQCLKEQENAYYENLLNSSGIPADGENVNTFKTTTDYVNTLKYSPAYALNLSSADETLEDIADRAANVEESLKKANQSYETMMTTPRKDLGDSITKAFSNVDDILRDLGLEVNKSNQRAVRILAYNQLDINVENINRIKAVDEEVQRTFSNLTPKTTLEMIRQGIQPLEMTISELNDAAAEIKQSTEETDNERFSKYLWKLEQNHAITEEERSSYIGIYRLIAQVEKTDGAVIGSLINQGADITMKNLLTAVRSQKKAGMEYTVDDNFEGVNAKTDSPKIDEQINTAYRTNVSYQADIVSDIMDNINPEALNKLGDKWENMTPEEFKEAISELEDSQDNAYVKQQLADYRKAIESAEDIYDYLDRYDIRNSLINVMSESKYIRQPNRLMEELWSEEGLSADSLDKIRWMKEELLERFGEAVKTPQEMADAQETLAEVATNVMKTMINDNEKITARDLKELRLMNNQFSLCAQKAREESYMIPVQTGDDVTGVSLKIIRGKEDKGLVDIFFRGEMMGKVAAAFEAREEGISGVIATSDEETRQLLSDNLGLFAGSLNNDGKESVDLRVALIPDLSSEKFEAASLQKELNIEKDETSNKDNTVQTSRLYHVAEGFIQTVSELFNI